LTQNTSSNANQAVPGGASTEATVARGLVYFGAPPLVDCEDEGAYNRLLAQIIDRVKPTDIVEMMWVRDVVDSQWEINRYRRAKANLIAIAKHVQSEKAFHVEDNHSPSRIPEGTFQWMVLESLKSRDRVADAEAIAEAKARAIADAEPGAEAKDVARQIRFALAVERKVDALERLDRMIMNAQAGRDNAYFQLEKRRVAGAKRGEVSIDEAKPRGYHEAMGRSSDLEHAA
jgi:hypothetical protein